MTTETLIKRLRSFLPPGPLALEIMMEAAARLESNQWELTQAIAERTPHDYGLLKEEAAFLRKERDEALAEVKRKKLEPETVIQMRYARCPIVFAFTELAGHGCEFIRRQNWLQGTKLRKHEHYMLTAEDILSNDWEIWV